MDRVMEKKLPIGIEDFEKLRKENFFYIDKTGLIKELLLNWGEENLFTRPRRFGKTLNMSMLKSFFEPGGNQKIFDGLEITKESAICEEYMGKFPVVFISLKGMQADSYANARDMAVQIMNREARRLQYLLDSERLTTYDKAAFTALLDPEMNEAVLCSGLRCFTELLEKHYEHKVILLIDEYDVPLSKAFDQGYYDRMITLIRNMFEEVLKTNSSLQFAVLTGCLRISKESIFTGLNNPKILSITSLQFEEHFGFTDQEVRKLLEYYNISASYHAVKEWYDGYQFGNTDVYCPWDVINYCDSLRADHNAQPEDYWSNTSSNDVVRYFIKEANTETMKREIEQLVAGEAVIKEIHQELTYKELYQSIDNLWSVLFTTGYLTQRGRLEGDDFRLVIPNMEIRKIFTRQIMVLFKETVQKDGKAVDEFCEALKNGNAKSVELQFTSYLKKTISIRDTFVRKHLKENFYHGILLGILGFKDTWGVSSNRESGDGYSDILIEIDDEDKGIVIEVKYPNNGNLDKGCQEALEQIEKNGYEQRLYDEGIRRILKYGIACYKNRCKVVLAADSIEKE